LFDQQFTGRVFARQGRGDLVELGNLMAGRVGDWADREHGIGIEPAGGRRLAPAGDQGRGQYDGAQEARNLHAATIARRPTRV
jgi:hypothetical protein